MTTKEIALEKIIKLVNRFDEQIEDYKRAEYNETKTRRDFLDAFFSALGWDMDNEEGYTEAYREVIHEDRVKIDGATKAPDYAFRLVGGTRLFFVEAKKPSVNLTDKISPAYQVRRYAWNAKLSISILTDFEEFSIYDCTKKPKPDDKPSVARVKHFSYKDYIAEFDFIWDTFGKENVPKGKEETRYQSATPRKTSFTVIPQPKPPGTRR